MNYKYLALAAGVALTSCGGRDKASNEAENVDNLTPAQTLIAQLDSVAKSDKFYFGHADDPAYGYDWEYQEGMSDVKSVTGEYPGLMNWDLGLIELDSARNLDGVPFAFMADEIVKQNERGGINAISWHVRNPQNGGDSWDVSVSPLHIIAGDSVMSATLDSWIGKTADFILSLKDKDGNLIPIIFRPWHENTGNWFWWGAANSTADEYKDLWKRTRKIFDEKGVNNVVWAYSPGTVKSRDEYVLTYPGDEYVDILGVDAYHSGGEAATGEYISKVNEQLGLVVDEANKHGKIAAFTETGLEGVTIPEWYTKVLLPTVKDLPIAYVCVWRNANKDKKAGHFYVPYPGHPAAADFKAFHDSPNTIFVK